MPRKVDLSPHYHIQGNPSARIILVEYGDFECPHCGHAYWALKDLQEQYGEDLCLVYRHFPLTQIHPMAEPAAEASEFAAQQGRFWEMHDAIYENQQRLSPQMLLEISEGLALDREGLRNALEEHRFSARVREEFLTGVRLGVNGTPTFFLNGARFDGSVEDFPAVFDEVLRSGRAA